MTMKKKSFLEKIVGSEKEKQEGDEVSRIEVNDDFENEISEIMKNSADFENHDGEGSDNIKEEGHVVGENVESESGNQDWNEKENIEDGQLTVDVYKIKDYIVIKSIIGGVRSEDLDISVTSDMVTIKGKRNNLDEVKLDDYYYQECFWGNFSRSIILPCDIKTEGVEALIKNGILTLRLPKIEKNSLTKIKVIEE